MTPAIIKSMVHTWLIIKKENGLFDWWPYYIGQLKTMVTDIVHCEQSRHPSDERPCMILLIFPWPNAVLSLSLVGAAEMAIKGNQVACDLRDKEKHKISNSCFLFCFISSTAMFTTLTVYLGRGSTNADNDICASTASMFFSPHHMIMVVINVFSSLL